MTKFKTVLLIEDDPTATMLCSIHIKKASLAENIVSFTNGKEALDYLLTLTETDYPEVIFLDLNMPVMDGWYFLEELEKDITHPQFHPLIYLMTLSVDPSDAVKANKFLKVQGFIEKPLSKENIERTFADKMKNEPQLMLTPKVF